MRGVWILLMSIGSAMMAIAPVANAAGGGFSTNGQIASSIETKLQDYMMSNEVEQFGFSIYQQGKDYGAQGQSYVSTNPKQEFVDRHMAAHCSPSLTAEKEGFNCQGAQGATPEDQKYFEMGDIKFSVLLEPDVYTEGTTVMAHSLIRNIVNPFPDNKMRDYVTKKTLGSDTKALEAYADYLAKQAVLGVAMYSMNEMYGMRVPGKALGLTDPGVADSSLMKVMDTEASRRFLESDFEAFLNTPTTSQLDVMKEMARMQAFSLWMNYLSYRQNERIEALVAAALAQTVNAALETKKMLSR